MRYFFQWIVLISLALSLAACGGSSGSKGDTGATGATGATGTGATGDKGDKGDNGSIAVPTATANSIAFGGTELDTDYSLTGYNPGSTIVVKVDNVTDAGDRTRYYMYWGTGESTKKNLAELDSSVPSGGQISSFNGVTSVGANTQAILDPRMMSADNFTLAAPSSTRTITSDVTHLLVYAGNEAGDASSGKALAITNRGLNTGASGTDNVTSTFLLPGSTATNFDISQVKLSDNASHQLAVTDTKSTDTTTIASTATGSGASQTTLATRDVTQHSGTNYILTATDNGTIYTVSSGTPSSSATDVFNQAAVNNHLELHSDGTNMIALADNSSNTTANINVYNLTTPASPARVGSQLSVSGGGIGRFCGSVANSSVIIAHDNSTDNTSNIFLSSTPIDNTTGWEYTSTISASLDNTSTVGDANQQYCAMAGFDVGSKAHFYLAIDNTSDSTGGAASTGFTVYRIIDNGSAIESSTLLGGVNDYTVDSLAIDVTSDNVPVVAVDNASGDSYLLKWDNSSSWTLLSSSGLGIRGVDNTTGIDLLINSDDSKFGVLGVSGSSGANYSELRVFYDQ